MAETLTQAEIDALRDAVRSGRVEDVANETRAEQPAAEIKVVSYDFRKPQLLSAEHLQSMQSLHLSFAKNIQGLLFSMFKISGETTLSALDQVSYGEFMLALESPTYLLGVSIDQAGPIGLEVAPPTGQILLDMLLGGDGIASAAEPPREFSALEMDIMRAWIDRGFEELVQAWEPVQQISFSVIAQGIEPDQVQVVPLDTPCLCAVMKLRLNEAEGRIQICYPFSTLQAIFQRADSHSDAPEGQRAELRKQALAAMDFVPIKTDIELGKAQVSAQDIESLGVGDIIKLGSRAGDPLVLNVGGRGVGHASVGVYRGRLAVTVEDLNAHLPEPSGTAAAKMPPTHPPTAPKTKP